MVLDVIAMRIVSMSSNIIRAVTLMFWTNVAISVDKKSRNIRLRMTAPIAYMTASMMKGSLMNSGRAPTSLMIRISLRLVKIAIWIAFKMIRMPPMTNVSTTQNMICFEKLVTFSRFFATEEMMPCSFEDWFSSRDMFEMYFECLLPIKKFSISLW